MPRVACYHVHCNIAGQEENVRNMLLTFDPQARITADAGQGFSFEILTLDRGFSAIGRFYAARSGSGAGVTVSSAVRSGSGAGDAIIEERLIDCEISDPRYPAEDLERRIRERIRLLCLRLMARATGQPTSPWGILTGIRPTKIYFYLSELGFTADEIRERLVSVYGLAPAKADLVREVAQVEEPYLKIAADQVGVYIGIPFCPTRCHYCSFASYPLSTHGHLVPRFLEAVTREIQAVSACLRSAGLKINCLYVGGGTPTALPDGAFETLMQQLSQSFQIPAQGQGEFTVEAGRPDTISYRKAMIIKAAGANRVSVNPQTMNEKTLAIIGRDHTAAEVYRAVECIRAAGIANLNMDLIAGLPGETCSDMEQTLLAIQKLAPENLTVHTLAIKRASQWRHNLADYDLPSAAETAAMVELASQAAVRMGMHPYYLYRQRFILANLENLGYSLPGNESPYNIQMIEERQTVVGLGGGGVTRMVQPQSGKVERLFNPKCPATYFSGIEEIISRKVKSIEGLFH